MTWLDPSCRQLFDERPADALCTGREGRWVCFGERAFGYEIRAERIRSVKPLNASEQPCMAYASRSVDFNGRKESPLPSVARFRCAACKAKTCHDRETCDYSLEDHNTQEAQVGTATNCLLYGSESWTAKNDYRCPRLWRPCDAHKWLTHQRLPGALLFNLPLSPT